MSYKAHENLVAPARDSAGLGRLAGGVVLTAVLFMALSFTYSTLHRQIAGPEAWADFAPHLESGDTPAAVLINLFLFGLMIIALAVALGTVHGRGLGSVIGPLPRALQQFVRVGIGLVAFYLLISLIPLGAQLTPEPNLEPGRWLALLPLGVLALLIQTSAEEMVFRGYLQSQLAARFSHPVIWMGVPSVAFALLHYAPVTHGGNTWLVMGWAALFGVAAADLTARAGTLGPAIALHLLNNISAILFVAPEGTFDGLALYTYPFSLSDTGAVWVWAPLDVLMLGCGWLVARIALRR